MELGRVRVRVLDRAGTSHSVEKGESLGFSSLGVVVVPKIVSLTIYNIAKERFLGNAISRSVSNDSILSWKSYTGKPSVNIN